MTNPLLEPTTELRHKAFQSVVSTPQFAVFKAMDAAVVAAGGVSMLSKHMLENDPTFPASKESLVKAVERVKTRRKLTQTSAAASALREKMEPMPIAQLLSAIIDRGIVFRGGDPLPSFRSAMSKDTQFSSFIKSGTYFWWFKDEPLPSGWNEAEGADLLAHPSASSVHSNQEGGGGHAATTT
jgi:hypothetical protein